MNISHILKNKKSLFVVIPMLILIGIFTYLNLPQKDNPQVLGSTSEMESVVLDITPELDFSRFAPYTATATQVPPSPSNVSLNLSVDMGDDNNCWDFNTIGECASQPLQFNMTYNEETSSYTKPVYPDYIYPEIFFAPSEVTWNNAPLNTPIRRNDYQIFHFTNNFSIVSGTNIWVEFNTAPLSVVNSSDLLVYIVEKGHDITYFNSDWRVGLGTELIGSISKNATVNHIHTENSSHHLVRLSTDENGKVGNKALDISEDFWVVLYANSPNVSRGWNLRYQPNTLCNNNGTWFKGDISGWTTTSSSGCPDAHIHISRSNINYLDTVQASVSATYDDGTYTSPVSSFTFAPLPNLPPNSSSFLSPIAGSKYSGSINVEWDPTTDPNPTDTVYYTIYLTQNGQLPITLVSSTTDTSLTLDTTLYSDDSYSLSGKVCDNLGLCTETNFSMSDPFYIDNIYTPETLTSITVSSNNQNSGFAKAGDIVSISMTATGVISQPTVNIYSNGNSVTNSVTVTNTESNSWVASYIVSSQDSSGDISFEISSSSLDRIYFQSTDQSNVSVDVGIPNIPTASLESGTYLNNQSITLTSSEDAYIKYLFNVDTVSCTTGVLYELPIEISSNTNIKAIACDSAGNSSSIATFTYTIQRALTSIQISSSNSNPSYAKVGDTVNITFQSSGDISTPNVNIYSGGVIVTDFITLSQTQPNIWSSSFEISDTDTEGVISFDITGTDLTTTYTLTTDESSVIVDLTNPSNPTSSLASGEYISQQEIILSSTQDANIRYTINQESVSCTTGELYDTSLIITQDSIVKAIACDMAGNISNISTFEYIIKETLESITISSSNRNSSYAKVGDILTLSFTASSEISQPTVNILVANEPLLGSISLLSNDNISWESKYTVLETETNGLISFSISSNILNTVFTETTNLSRVTIDTQAPVTPLSNISSGTYSQSQVVTLTSSSSSSIRYTLNGDTPNCLNSSVYLSPLNISTSKVLKAISCDSAGNQSGVLTVSIAIFPDSVIVDTSTIPTEEWEDDLTQDTVEEEKIEEIDLTTLKFRILDSKYLPIPNLKVTLHSDPKTEFTDINGIVIFEDVPLGNHKLIYSYNDIEYEKSIEVSKEDIQEDVNVEILDIITEEEASSNTYLIYICVFVFLLLLFVIIRGVVRNRKNIDKEVY